jgi:ABC-type uncharacterized transport system auxiliary subunit
MKGKYSLTVGIALATAALLAGCDSEKKPKVVFAAALTNAAASSRIQFRRATAREAIEESRVQILIAADKNIEELDASIAELTKKSESYQDNAKVKADQALDSLRNQRARVRDDLDELKKISLEGWGETRPALDRALDELQGAYETAKTAFD